MPVTTRLKARSVQSTDLVSSPGANTPRLSDDSRQGNAVVTDSLDEGAPFEEVANEDLAEFENKNYNIKTCENSRCLTCKKLVTSKIYYSNHSKKVYKVIDHAGEDLSCSSTNLVYLLACEGCGIQYVGETVQPLRARITQHRTSRSGCTNVINHRNNTCHKEFSVQIIIKLKGNGRNDC